MFKSMLSYPVDSKKIKIVPLALSLAILFMGCQSSTKNENNSTERTITEYQSKEKEEMLKSQEGKLAGTPITTENVADVMEIQRVADAMSNAVDAKNWLLVRSFTTDEVLTSLGTNESQKMLADDLVERFKTNLSAKEMNSHHMRTNQRVYFHNSDEATMFSKGLIVVTRTPGGEHEAAGGSLLIENWISYEHGMIRTSEGWKVNRILTESLSSRTTSLAAKD